MFTLVRQCEKFMLQPRRLTVKDTIKGHKFEPCISCSFYIIFTPKDLHCTVNQSQGHNNKSWVWALHFLPLQIPFTPKTIWLNFGQVFTLVSGSL